MAKANNSTPAPAAPQALRDILIGAQTISRPMCVKACSPCNVACAAAAQFTITYRKEAEKLKEAEPLTGEPGYPAWLKTFNKTIAKFEKHQNEWRTLSREWIASHAWPTFWPSEGVH